MKNNKKSNKEYIITWRWIDEEEIQQEYGNSAGLASLLADWCVEVLKVEAV
jgi:hypothetical protein